jgi:hypothetical protein
MFVISLRGMTRKIMILINSRKDHVLDVADMDVMGLIVMRSLIGLGIEYRQMIN